MGKADTLIITKSYTIRSDLAASPYQSGAIIFGFYLLGCGFKFIPIYPIAETDKPTASKRLQYTG